MAALPSLDKLTELRSRLLFLLGALVVYRAGTFVPVPGIDATAMAALFDQQRGTILSMFNMFSGGALERLSIFALGIMPYISASIIVQLMSYVIPSLEQLRKDGGNAGKRKMTQYTRYLTLLLATLQSIGVSVALQSQQIAGQSVVIVPGMSFTIIAVITLVTGTMFLLWLGEQITERGIGNGISMLIFAGIVAELPSAVGATLELARTGELAILVVIFIMVLVLATTAFVVFIERGQRRITVNYAKRQVGRKMYGGQTSHLPLKLNMAGVIPPIFASSLILFPATLGSWFGSVEGMDWLREISSVLMPGQPIYIALYTGLIIFFCFFYTALVFNTEETADNLKKSGAFIPGVRPGKQTADYVDRVLTRLTFAGALYIAAVCLLPEILNIYLTVPFYFGGTSLLIIVVVVMDFISQVQTHLMSHQYESLLKKASFKGSTPGLR